MRFQSPRGTQDVLPGESRRWAEVETRFRDLARRFGYAELRTPTFEDTNLFLRTAGESTDIVTKEMYTFQDRGERSMTLKPEGTAPALRAALQHSLHQGAAPLRLFYITPFFRYERPQAGRFREAHQAGLELIGSDSPAADAEVIEATVRFYRELGLDGLVVQLNSLGRDACRSRYRAALLDHAAAALAEMAEEPRARAEKNPLRLLDSKDPALAEAMASAPLISAFLEPESLGRQAEICRLLELAGVRFELAPRIVRGLDYYTETVFEVHSDKLGAQSQLCGGGRYDGLMRELGGPDTPCVGVGIGLERLMMVLGPAEPASGPEVYVAQGRPEAEAEAIDLVAALRRAGVAATRDYAGKTLTAQLKLAARGGARTALILAEAESARGAVLLKRLATGEQQELSREAALAQLAAEFGS